MKKVLFPVLLMLLAGCDYDVPLSQTPSAPADAALAGSWVGQEPKDVQKAPMEIKISGTDYYVTYGASSNALYFKGFEVKAAGLNLIQLELQGADTNKYLFVKYELTSNGLSFCCLDTKVVSAKCQSTEELLSDLTVHRKNPFLFTEPMKFTKSVPQ